MNTIVLTPLSAPIKSSVSIPGSKSYTNRAIFLAALCNDSVRIHNALLSDDTKAMINCLKTLGIHIEEENNTIFIHGGLHQVKAPSYTLDCDLSGTTMRFLVALSAILPTEIVVTGKEGLCKRPIKDLANAIQQIGAKVEHLEQKGFPPLKIKGNTKNTTNSITVNGSTSSQFISALLMIAPLIKDLEINVPGEQISKPYIDMTIYVMEQFGVHVNNSNYQKYTIDANQTYHAKDYTVEGDISSASYFAAIAALTKSTITLEHVSGNSKQADIKFFEILEKMGNYILYENNAITIVGKQIHAIEVDMTDCPDQVQTLAVLSAFTSGKTTITGVKSLRVKETERVQATQLELEKMGIRTESTDNILTIYGGTPHEATIDTYGDHRMAMAFAVAGTKLPGLKIHNPEVVSKTFPNFFELLQKVGVGVKSI